MKTGAAPDTITLNVHSVERLLDADGSPLLCPRIHPEAARSILYDADAQPRVASCDSCAQPETLASTTPAIQQDSGFFIMGCSSISVSGTLQT